MTAVTLDLATSAVGTITYCRTDEPDLTSYRVGETVELEPTTTEVKALFVERTSNGVHRRWVDIPDVVGPINYLDLIDIDPDTLDPTTPVVPVYQAMFDALDDALAAEATTRDTADQALATVINDYATALNTALGTVSAASAQKNAYLSDITDRARAREQLSLGEYDRMRPFFAKLANWRNARVEIAYYGDSSIEGYGLTNWEYTLPAQLASQLRARHGITSGAKGLVPLENDLTNQSFWPHVYTGGTMTAVGYGLNMRQINFTRAGQKFVHTVATPLTSFYIHYAIFGTGTFYYKIDGGAPVNVVANGTATIVPTRLLVSAAVTSTIEIGWVSGVPYITGIQENKNDETSGLQVHNLGVSGSSANLWVGQTAARSWPLCGAALSPSLVIVQLGGNDGRILGSNRTAAQFQSDLTTLLGTIGTTVSTTAPIIVSMCYNMGDVLLREPWANYVAAARTVVAANARTVLVDHSARMYAANATDTDGLYNAASPPHAAAKGYALMAATNLAALTPR